MVDFFWYSFGYLQRGIEGETGKETDGVTKDGVTNDGVTKDVR